jgi:hypothetical protein
MTRYRGACHCAAVTFEIDAADVVEQTTCDCTLCRKKNAQMIAVHESRFRLLTGHGALGLYRWNTGRARHHFCTTCGIYTFHRKRSAPDHYGVNVFCLEGFDTHALPIRRADGLTMSVAAGAPAIYPGPRETG